MESDHWLGALVQCSWNELLQVIFRNEVSVSCHAKSVLELVLR